MAHNFSDQLKRAEIELAQAHDKTEALRHEKLFLTQEKGQADGALRQLQMNNKVV